MSKFHALKSLTQPKAYVISAQIRLSYSNSSKKWKVYRIRFLYS